MEKYHLGINLGHDRSAALVKGGAVCTAIQQERLDRYKHSIGFLAQSGANPAQVELPSEAINYCLETANIDWDDVATITANIPGIDYGDAILRRKLPPSQHNKIRRIPSHHLAHAYTAYWPSGFENSLILVADASGSTNTEHLTESYTLYRGEGSKILSLHSEKVQSHLADLSTLGFVYEYISRKADFVTRLEGGISIPESGKLMGLAPFGGKQTQWKRWFKTQTDNYSLGISAYDIFLEIAALEKHYDTGKGKAYLRPYLVDLAYKAQDELEQALLHIVDTAQRETGLSQLCLAGGVALNSVANYLLYQKLNLQNIFTYPAAGDAGISAGCALWAYATQEEGQNRVSIKSASLGRKYDENTILSSIENQQDKLTVEKLSEENIVTRCAKALANGHIVARIDGGSEYGPRALGHRSILADPSFEKMRDIINARVKFRESFRPFAPVIPEECVNEVFEHDLASPFMLLISPIHKHYQNVIPSVTHHDGTGRLQTVTAEANPFMHSLCHQISAERSGPPVVLNTSFNIAGQPIVETPEEAIETFLTTDIDYLCIGTHWISRKDQAVLDYEEHLEKVNITPEPHGLEPEQDSVDRLMEQLDRALFFPDQGASCPWSEKELKKLSSFGARFKETSCLYPESGLGQSFSSKINKDIVLQLDPLGYSVVTNLQSNKELGQYCFEDVQLLMAIYHNDQEQLSLLRRERQCNGHIWHGLCEWAIGELTAFDLDTALLQAVPLSTPDSVTHTIDMTTLSSFANPSFTLRVQLRKFQQILTHASYDEKTIASRLGVESLQQIEPTHLDYYCRFKLGQTPLDDLIRLFLLRGSLSRSRIDEQLGENLSKTLIDVGVLIERREQIASRVDIFAVEGNFFATDHRFMLLPEDRIDENPVMYIGLDSLGLALTAPRYICNKALDLCTGSGIQAITASRYVNSVTAVDLNPRAIRFTRFNSQLNGIDNVFAVQSDLYNQITDGPYDIILANPPFVPSPESELKFRDGGQNGEQILARIIQESAQHLNKDGRLHIVTDLVEISNYQQKLSHWWEGGPSEKTLLTTADRDEMLFAVPHSHSPFAQSFEDYNLELERWVENFRNADLNSVNFGYILIHQHPDSTTDTYTAKVIHSPRFSIHDSVKLFLKQLHLLNSSAKQNDLFIHVNSDICIREERQINGTINRIELYVPDNPLFTAYRIDPSLLEILYSISNNPIQLKYLDPASKPLILELANKGLINVSETSTAHKPPLLQKSEKLEYIQELSSCTTPTCLTSYMQG